MREGISISDYQKIIGLRELAMKEGKFEVRVVNNLIL